MSTTYTHVYSDALACLVCELSDDNIYFDKHKVRKEAIPSFGEKKKCQGRAIQAKGVEKGPGALPDTNFLPKYRLNVIFSSLRVSFNAIPK